MPRRRIALPKIEADVRTEDMSDEALDCRRNGHQPKKQSVTRKRYQELIRGGLFEDQFECSCGRYRHITWEIATGRIVEDKQGYRDKTYLLPKGSGRLTREEARVAWAARRIASYA